MIIKYFAVIGETRRLDIALPLVFFIKVKIIDV